MLGPALALGGASALGGYLNYAGNRRQANRQNRILRDAAAGIPTFDAFMGNQGRLSGEISRRTNPFAYSGDLQDLMTSREGDFSYSPETARFLSDRSTPFSFDLKGAGAGELQPGLVRAVTEGLTDYTIPMEASRRRVSEDALATYLKQGMTGGGLTQGVVEATAPFEERLNVLQEQIRQGRVGQASGLLSQLVNQLAQEEQFSGGRLSQTLGAEQFGEEATGARVGQGTTAQLAAEQATVGRLTQALEALGMPYDAAVQRARILAGQQAPPNAYQALGSGISDAASSAGLLYALQGMGGGRDSSPVGTTTSYPGTYQYYG
jgi:hypothetical protein